MNICLETKKFPEPFAECYNWIPSGFCQFLLKNHEKYLCRFTWIGTLTKVAALKDAGYEPFVVEAGTYSEIRPFFFLRPWVLGVVGGLSCKIIFGGHPKMTGWLGIPWCHMDPYYHGSALRAELVPLISSCELLRCKAGVFLRPGKDVVGVGCNYKFAAWGVTISWHDFQPLACTWEWFSKYPLPFEFMVAHCGQWL